MRAAPFSAWEINAVQALYAGASTGGAPGGPTYYQAQSAVTAHEGVVTTFNSWKGLTNPGVAVGPA